MWKFIHHNFHLDFSIPFNFFPSANTVLPPRLHQNEKKKEKNVYDPFVYPIYTIHSKFIHILCAFNVGCEAGMSDQQKKNTQKGKRNKHWPQSDSFEMVLNATFSPPPPPVSSDPSIVLLCLYENILPLLSTDPLYSSIHNQPCEILWLIFIRF